MSGSDPGSAPGPVLRGPGPDGAGRPEQAERTERARVLVRLGVFAVVLVAAAGVGAAVGALLPEGRDRDGTGGPVGPGTGPTTTLHDMEGHR